MPAAWYTSIGNGHAPRATHSDSAGPLAPTEDFRWFLLDLESDKFSGPFSLDFA
jgi:hypothetical protein